MAALVRAYVAVKTYPRFKRMAARGKSLAERKEGYSDWQLLEET